MPAMTRMTAINHNRNNMDRSYPGRRRPKPAGA
jgi:hypothetical protein